MDQLALKYTEMCKVESSTDSDSEISPRWSDTSVMGCVSSAPESGTSKPMLPLTHKPARHGCYSLFLDPYDGSSEDSDGSNVNMGVSNRRARQQGRGGGGGGGGGGCRFSGRNRRFHHPSSLREDMKNGNRDAGGEQQPPLDVQMKCGSDPELLVCNLDPRPSHSDREDRRDPKEKMAGDSEMHAETMDIEQDGKSYGSSVHASTSSKPQTHGPVTPEEASLSRKLNSSSERSPSPSNLRPLPKRKLGVPGAELVELGQRKRQCVINMEDKQEGVGSASEPLNKD